MKGQLPFCFLVYNLWPGHVRSQRLEYAGACRALNWADNAAQVERCPTKRCLGLSTTTRAHTRINWVRRSSSALPATSNRLRLRAVLPIKLRTASALCQCQVRKNFRGDPRLPTWGNYHEKATDGARRLTSTASACIHVSDMIPCASPSNPTVGGSSRGRHKTASSALEPPL